MGTVKRLNSSRDLEKIRREIKAKTDPNGFVISVCGSTGCVALGAKKIMSALKAELEHQGLTSQVRIKETGCVGFCEQGPRITIYP